MTYLLAKFTVLFLLTAILGFALGYWFCRRKFVDVSESYEDMRTANSRSDTMQWEMLWRRLDSMPTPKDPDFTDVNERIAGVSSAISSLPRPQPVSFAPVESRLDSLRESIDNIPVPVRRKDPDYMPLIERLDKLEEAVGNLPKPAPQRDVDLAPIDGRLTAIEVVLGNLDKRLTTRTTNEQAPQTTNRKEPKILSAALYGKGDNLKLISGVGPKLEKLLNKNGVYYFWQVAEWNDRDIDVIDERLDTFKGRIARDNWVRQAKQLRRTPEAASMPAE